MANAISKLVSKVVAGFILGQLFGTIGHFIGWLVGDHIGEFGTQQLENFFPELGKETGKTLTDNKDNVKKFIRGKLTSNNVSEIDSSLALLLCNVWEKRIKNLIEKKNFDDSSFQKQVKLLEKYEENFKKAQNGNSSIVFYDIFPKDSRTNFEIELDNFELLNNKEKIRESLWINLQKTLSKWTTKGEQEIYQFIEFEIKTALTANLQSDLLIELKKNDSFQKAFNSTFQFFVTDVLKLVREDVKDTKENTEKIIRILEPSVDYDSQLLKQEFLEYLQRVSEEAIDIKSFFPTHLQNKSLNKSPFDNIRQRVFVTEKKSWDDIRARIEEQNKIKGLSNLEGEKTAHKYRLTTGSDIKNHQENLVRIFDWNTENAKEFERAVFLGDPGFGKSWLLCFETKRIALNSINQLENDKITLKNAILPIRLRLSTLAEKTNNEILARSIAKLCAFRGENEPFSKEFEEYIYERIKAQENVVILLDALDEVPENPQRGIGKDKLKIKLEGFSNDFPKISIYITSRIVGYNNLNISNSKELELLPFENEQIRNFTKVWFGKDKEKDNRFHDLLENQPQTAGLAQIPLMLSLLCKIFDEQTSEESFPETRGEIYRKCLIGLLRDWKKENERKSIDDTQLDFRLKFLEKLAFKLFEKQQEQFAETSFTEILCETLGISIDDFSAEEKVIKWKNRLEQDGIIKKAVQGEKPEYLFLHLTFQEYLAASYLAKMPNWKEFVFQDKILFNPRWQEVLTLLGGTLSKEKVKDYIESLLEKNGENGEGDLLFRPLILAIFAGKESSESLDIALREFLLNKLTSLYVNPPKHLHRYYFKRVNKVWKDKIETSLLNMLSIEVNSQSSFDTRFGAISIAHDLNIKNKKIIKKIDEILNQTTSFDEKIMASLTLCENGFANTKAVDILVEMLLINRRADTHFGFALLQAEEYLPKVINTFVKFVYLEDIATFSTRHLLQVLRNFNNLPESLVNPLIEILTDKKLEKHYFHEVVIDGLLNNKNTRKENFHKLLLLLKDENIYDQIRGKIARGITRYKNLSKIEVRELLRFFLEENKDFWVSYELIPELAKLSVKHPSISKELIKFAKDTSQDDYLRVYSAWQLSEVPNPPKQIVDFLFDVAVGVELIPREKNGTKFILSRLENPPKKAVEIILDSVEKDDLSDEHKETLVYNLMKSKNPSKEIVDKFLEYARKEIFIGRHGQETRLQPLLMLDSVPDEAINIAIEFLSADMPSAENKQDICLQLVRYLPENHKVQTALLHFIIDEKVDRYHRYKVANELLLFDSTRDEAEHFFQSFWDNDKANNFNFGTTVIQELYNLFPSWLKFSKNTADGFLKYLAERITQRNHYFQDELYWENIFLLRISSNYSKSLTIQ